MLSKSAIFLHAISLVPFLRAIFQCLVILCLFSPCFSFGSFLRAFLPVPFLPCVLSPLCLFSSVPFLLCAFLFYASYPLLSSARFCAFYLHALQISEDSRPSKGGD